MFPIDRKMRVVAGLGLCAALGLWMAGCGSASKNDNGESFTMLGFFVPSETTEDCGDFPAGVSVISMPLSQTDQQEGEDSQFSGAGVAAIGVQNNLSGEFIQTERVFFDYSIADASAQPPSTSLPLSAIVGPATSGSEGGSGSTGSSSAASTVSSESTTKAGAAAAEVRSSSLPDSFSDVCNRAFISTFVVPPDVRSWMILNRDLLPEPPFNVIVTARVQGSTSANDTMISNSTEVIVQMRPDTVIAPEGASGSTGSSGSSSSASESEEGASSSESEAATATPTTAAGL